VAAVVLPGWYGKLPALGDFAGRRLPPLFVEPWDHWLALGMSHWREHDPAWLEAFLAAPIWRFALGAGVPFDLSPGYAGVMMPSVDRVGRYFPLTIARPRGPREATAPAGWLQTIEGVAVTALNEDWDAQRLDAGLGEVAAELAEVEDAGPPWPDKGRVLWWCDLGGDPVSPVATVGLPLDDAFARLVSGRPAGGDSMNEGVL